MVRTVAPGKQCVVALKNLQYLMIESPTIRAVGVKSGFGGEESSAASDTAAGRLGCGEAEVATHRGLPRPLVAGTE